VGNWCSVIPSSEILGTKPPYVCLGCFIHTYSNNMINRFHGHRPGEGSPENGWNDVPVRAISPRLRKNGEGMEVSLTGCKKGRRRVRHDRVTVRNDRRRRRSVEWALRTQKQAIEGEVSVVMAGGCSSSFYSGRGREHRGGGGGNGRR
jgi:hypothetical protein